MTAKAPLLIVILSSLPICFSQQIGATLPVRISSAVVDGTGINVCPSQSSIGAELNLTKAEVQKVIINTINPTLNQMSTSPGSCNGTGWTRVAFLNMTDTAELCPSTLSMISSPIRGCGRRLATVFTCESIHLTLNSKSYSRVCGQIIAYQRGTTDAFHNAIDWNQTTIDSAYMDGVSLTHGPAGSRQHIWTFVAALYKDSPSFGSQLTCACTNTRYNWPYQVPAFIGSNYFCDTGNPGPDPGFGTYFTDDPLWDGKGCGPFSTCCQFNNPPWFQTALPQTTSDDIELRLCHGEAGQYEENTIINLIEIYVK